MYFVLGSLIVGDCRKFAYGRNDARVCTIIINRIYRRNVFRKTILVVNDVFVQNNGPDTIMFRL